MIKKKNPFDVMGMTDQEAATIQQRIANAQSYTYNKYDNYTTEEWINHLEQLEEKYPEMKKAMTLKNSKLYKVLK